MTATPDSEFNALLAQAAGGDADARKQLLTLHRKRLRRMVAFHMDRRVAARVDPSDVVQEAMVDAARELSDYLRRRPLPFYPWLRQLAWDRLVEAHRRHLKASKRSVRREEPDVLALPDESALELAQRLANNSTSPSEHMLRNELRQRVRAALDRLARSDREVLVLRHLEELATADAAAVLGISVGAFKSRHLRALLRLRELLADCATGGTS